MKSITCILLLSILFYTASCTEEKKPELRKFKQEELRQILPLSTTPAPAPGSTSPEVPSNTIRQSSAQEGVDLNPPHGQPGHDCAIPVGAPLNSKPQNINQGNAPAVTPITPTPAPAGQTNTLPASGTQRLNPPHGQPGHDCAVPVGAPLG